MAKMQLLDYLDNPIEVDFDLDNLDDVVCIVITVITGDETAEVVFKDGRMQHYDSCPGGRIADYFDDRYIIYVNGSLNHIDKWLTRKSSYDTDWRD